MPLITNSNQTLAPGAAGNWWTPGASVTVVTCDIDTAAMVKIETRRGSGDTAAKPVLTADQRTAVLRGPSSTLLQVVAGRDYRYVGMEGAATVAAFE